MKKLVLVLALLVAIPVMLVGCSKSQVPAVEDSINGFADAYNQGDYQTCTDYLVGITDANRDATANQLSAFHQLCTSIQVNSIDDIIIDKSRATASVTLTALGKQMTIELSLTKADDTWQFSFGDMVTAISQQFGSRPATSLTRPTLAVFSRFSEATARLRISGGPLFFLPEVRDGGAL